MGVEGLLGARLTLPALLILLLLPLVVVIYLAALSGEGGTFGFGPSIHIGTPGENNLLASETGYLLVSRGDNVSIDAIVSGVSPWRYTLSIADLATGRTYSYIATYYSSRAPIPVFIAPTSSLYFYNVTITAEGNVSEYTLTLKVSGQQALRREVVSRIPIVAAALVGMALAAELLSRRLGGKGGFIALLSWELRSLGVWVFYAASLYTYALFYLDLSSGVGRSKYILLKPVALSRDPDFFVVHLLLAASLTTMLYSYKWESGLERTMDLFPLGRARRFAAKLLVVFLLLYLPILIASLLVYVTWLPSLVSGNPGLFIETYLMGQLHYLGITLLVTAFSLLPATLIPRTSLALIAATLPGLLLYMGMPSVPVSLDLEKLLVETDPYRAMVPGGEVHRLMPLLLPVLALFTASLTISLLTYVRRENP